MRRFPILFAPLALLLVLNLVACGNKGPLVRPSQVEDVEDVAEDEPDAAEEQSDELKDLDIDDPEAQAEDADADPVEVPPPADPGSG